MLPGVTAAMAASTRASTSKVTLEASIPFAVRHRSPQTTTCRLWSRRHFSSCRTWRSVPKPSPPQPQTSDVISTSIRSLMRESAQPVALVTTFLSPTKSSQRQLHAATLSSFTSISLDPNLVCFSMKTPSKLADALASHVSRRSQAGGEGVDFVVNVLSRSQADLAAAYAVPGTPPLDYSETIQKGEQDHPLRQAGLVQVHLYGEAVPMVNGSLGALACTVVESIDLDRYRNADGGEPIPDAIQVRSSRLYIARVVHVFTPTDASRQPLVYHRQKFVSTSNISST